MEIIKSFIEEIINIYSNNPKLLLETFILITLCVLLKIYYPKFRGFMGEFWVKLELGKLPKDKYIALNDIMIKDDKGTHQIDHLVLSQFGIFVIEMKNYYGLIKGKEFDNKWCQYLGKTKNYFVNPIHQNYGHIKSLSNLLKLDDKYFISIICFSNQAKIDVKSNSILYGLKGISRVTEPVITEIMNNRPFNSLEDFLNKVTKRIVTKDKVINLIKSGAFNRIEHTDNIEQILRKYIGMITETKNKLTMQNANMLIENNLFPSTVEYECDIYKLT